MIAADEKPTVESPGAGLGAPVALHRPKWDIERILEKLIGQEIRVAAKAFSPPPGHHEHAPGLIPVRTLILPDNTQPSGVPVYFEGILKGFVRQIGVVFVHLESLVSQDTAADGTVPFRGKIAVIVRGPAVVQLASPFQVERLPADPNNYWRDVSFPQVQFEFPIREDPGAQQPPQGERGE